MSKRELLAKTLEWSGVGAVLASSVPRRNSLLVLNYHRIGNPETSQFDRAVWSATEDEFEQHVQFLTENCQVIGLDGLSKLDTSSGKPAVMMTFDDGYLDNYDLAFPILRRYEASAVFFLTSGFLDELRLAWWDEIAWMIRTSPRSELPVFDWCGEPLPLADESQRADAIGRMLGVYKSLPTRMTGSLLDGLAEATGSGRWARRSGGPVWMSWEQAREMDQAGMDIGGHTVTHPILANLDGRAQRREIERSKQRIEEELGHSIQAFSYPVGQPDSFTEETKQILQSVGYNWAFSFSGGYVPNETFDPMDIPRVAVSPHVSYELFRSTVRLPTLFA